MDNNELKPCACCNTDVELESWEVEHDHYDEYFYQIKCSNCGLMMKDSTTSNPYDNDIIKNLIGQWNTRACDCDKLSAVIQEISDYVFGNGLACMSGSKILESFVRHGLKVKCLEIGKTKIQSIKGE